ncbi:MAG: hypothetical protein HOO99_03950 [Hyphomicrobiaceae bacterium]|nr:hypothetical protein [Hyphomicrobiaceae bacterium]
MTNQLTILQNGIDVERLAERVVANYAAAIPLSMPVARDLLKVMGVPGVDAVARLQDAECFADDVRAQLKTENNS